MPSRNRAREAKKATTSTADDDTGGSKSKRTSSQAKNSGKSKASKAKRRTPKASVDPSDVVDAEVRFVQPYEASKTYLCPGCGRDILPGQGHLVAVPPEDPDLRRHWHRGCWNNRQTRR